MSVRVGVGVLARHPETGQVLLGKRIVQHGKDTYSFPGGHLEFGESFAACAERELLEETNLSLASPPVVRATLNNVFRESGKHYVTILMEGNVKDASALRNMEPDKCELWEWVTEDQVRAWIASGEKMMFAPLVSFYQENP